MVKKKNKEQNVQINKKKVLSSVDETHLKVKEVDFEKLFPTIANNVIVTVIDGRHHIILPGTMSGGQFKRWRNSSAGIFSKDVHCYNYRESDPKYVILIGEDEKIIVRLIDDEELDAFAVLKLIDGKIKDIPYMIFKRFINNKEVLEKQGYIKEKDQDIKQSASIILSSKDIPSLKSGASYSSHNLIEG